MTAQEVGFEISQEILSDIIMKQAGSLHKAILEGIQNAVDSGATECRINIEKTQVKITDNGVGMTKQT